MIKMTLRQTLTSRAYIFKETTSNKPLFISKSLLEKMSLKDSQRLKAFLLNNFQKLISILVLFTITKATLWMPLWLTRRLIRKLSRFQATEVKLPHLFKILHLNQLFWKSALIWQFVLKSKDKEIKLFIFWKIFKRRKHSKKKENLTTTSVLCIKDLESSMKLKNIWIKPSLNLMHRHLPLKSLD